MKVPLQEDWDKVIYRLQPEGWSARVSNAGNSMGKTLQRSRRNSSGLFLSGLGRGAHMGRTQLLKGLIK